MSRKMIRLTESQFRRVIAEDYDDEMLAYYIPRRNDIVFDNEGYEDDAIPIWITPGDDIFFFDVETKEAEDSLYELYGRRIRRLLGGGQV